MSGRQRSVVRELRRVRRIHRLGELEWFEVAYRAYLAALVGGFAILWLSDLVTDVPATATELADVTAHGPAVAGCVLAVAIAMGLRSGSDGGPIAVEAPDVRHLLLAPVARRDVLLAPVLQRLRAVTAGGALAGAIAGQLAARRLPGSGVAWAASGAVAGAAIGATFVAVAVVAHVVALPRWGASALAAGVLAWQAAAVVVGLPGPGDGIGSLALWGMRQRPLDLISLAGVVAVAAVALAVSGRLRSEPLVRRADLVSQLRFAVTMQDLRTVILLRRQLRDERPRRRPWLSWRGGRAGPGWAPWQRAWRGLLRYPAPRLARMAFLAAGAGAAVAVAARGTTPALVVAAVALHLLGLDALEPLAQEIDHPDRTDLTTHERGWLLVRLAIAPGIALVPFALLAAGVVIAADPSSWWMAVILAVPVTWAGAGGAAVSTVRDAPDPLDAPSSTAVPPEFAGFTSTIRLLWPVAVSALAVVAVFAVRESPTVGTVTRAVVGLALLLAAVLWWVRRRDDWRRRWRSFVGAGRARAGA